MIRTLAQAIVAGTLAVFGSIAAMNSHMDEVARHYPVLQTERERATGLALEMGLGAALGAAAGLMGVSAAFTVHNRLKGNKPKDLKLSDVREYAQKQLASSQSPTQSQFWLNVTSDLESIQKQEINTDDN